MQGNHDYFPMGAYQPGEDVEILEKFAQLWDHLLDSQAALDYAKNGWYNMKSPVSGLRILAINTQVADLLNFKLWRNATDPGGILEWMHGELLAAEKAEEKVLIIGHIPIGDHTCDTEFSRRHQVLSTRFQNTIIGQLYGHSHYDEFHVINSVIDNEPIGLVNVVPPLTTWQNHNPGFRVYEVDRETLQIVDYHQYRLALTESNIAGKGQDPIFNLQYSFKSFYNVTDYSPATWKKLAEAIETDQQIGQAYWLNFQSLAPAEGSFCTDACRKKISCSGKFSNFDEYVACLGSAWIDELPYVLMEKFMDPWVYKEQ